MSESAGPAAADSEAADTTTPTAAQTDDDAAVLDALAERLTGNGMRIVDRDDEEGTLTVAKLRDTYRVRPGEVIDGRFRQRLEQLVAEDSTANEGAREANR